MTLSEIYLEARDPAHGHMRAYRLTLGTDLFGEFMVEVRFGRIGCYGRAIFHSFSCEVDARNFMDACLRRRHGAPKRIGVSYVPVAA